MKNIILLDTTQRKQQHDVDIAPFEILTDLKAYEAAKAYATKAYATQSPLSESSKICLGELRKKHSSYKSQDKQHSKFDLEQHITLEQLIDKLIDCQMKCYYCNQEVVLLYNRKKDPLQWTLERLNNNLGHYASNTCISCLKCNLGRRTDNHEYYKKAKTMVLKKTDFN